MSDDMYKEPGTRIEAVPGEATNINKVEVPMSDPTPETLGTALPKEIERVQEILGHYVAAGPAGMFGAAMLKATLRAATEALASGDVVEMLRVYAALKECKE